MSSLHTTAAVTDPVSGSAQLITGFLASCGIPVTGEQATALALRLHGNGWDGAAGAPLKRVSDHEFNFTAERGQSVWLTVENISVLIKREHEGVAVDLFPVGGEDAESLAGTWLMYSECVGDAPADSVRVGAYQVEVGCLEPDDEFLFCDLSAFDSSGVLVHAACATISVLPADADAARREAFCRGIATLLHEACPDPRRLSSRSLEHAFLRVAQGDLSDESAAAVRAAITAEIASSAAFVRATAVALEEADPGHAAGCARHFHSASECTCNRGVALAFLSDVQAAAGDDLAALADAAAELVSAYSLDVTRAGAPKS